ncbi:MAG: hypothetical protein GY940_39370, partial [bacterium]|nr:hypothetical protein [bacterium]
MLPAHFVLLDRIPLTASGKVDRKALPEPGIKPGQEYTAPANEIEEKLTQIWSEILKIPPTAIGRDTSFFELGGHSLKATAVTARVHKTLNVKIPLPRFFKTPTIKDLSIYIKAGKEDKFIAMEPVEKKDYYPLSSAQKRLFTIQRVHSQSIAYNTPSMVRLTLTAKTEKRTFQETFLQLIKRHESLRTSFEIVKGKPVQRIRDDVRFKIEYDD